MKRMLFQTVMHSQQRYDTVGDYQEAHGFISFTVSDMNNWKYEALVSVHELVEKILVNARGIADKSIDDFDMDFEQNRDLGDESEPGDSRQAPYFAEHQFATMVEKMLAVELGVDWDHYDQAVLGLSK